MAVILAKNYWSAFEANKALFKRLFVNWAAKFINGQQNYLFG